MLTKRMLLAAGVFAVLGTCTVPAAPIRPLPWMRMHELLQPVNQTHEHGVEGLPDWYDPSCCNQQDCRPEPNENFDYVLALDEADGLVKPGVLYKPDNHVFFATMVNNLGQTVSTNKVKASQDERYHVCTPSV